MDCQRRLESSISWKATLHQPPNQGDSQGNFHIMENGEEGGSFNAKFLPTSQEGQEVVNFLKKANDQYEQVKNFFGCNPRIINDV